MVVFTLVIGGKVDGMVTDMPFLPTKIPMLDNTATTNDTVMADMNGATDGCTTVALKWTTVKVKEHTRGRMGRYTQAVSTRDFDMEQDVIFFPMDLSTVEIGRAENMTAKASVFGQTEDVTVGSGRTAKPKDME
mmetsp:Transcript_18655/g.38540  ORF Transcript_18655/g.38540 Transcript_18655/m.38540 type:complete len:134 (+) Transcript_18655:909-1310(+)